MLLLFREEWACLLSQNPDLPRGLRFKKLPATRVSVTRRCENALLRDFSPPNVLGDGCSFAPNTLLR